jgi:hypothetical protein
MTIDLHALLAETEYREWSDDEYEALSDAIASGDLDHAWVGPPRTGAAAAAAGRALMLAEFGSEAALDAYLHGHDERRRPQLAS